MERERPLDEETTYEAPGRKSGEPDGGEGDEMPPIGSQGDFTPIQRQLIAKVLFKFERSFPAGYGPKTTQAYIPAVERAKELQDQGKT